MLRIATACPLELKSESGGSVPEADYERNGKNGYKKNLSAAIKALLAPMLPGEQETAEIGISGQFAL